MPTTATHEGAVLPPHDHQAGSDLRVELDAAELDARHAQALRFRVVDRFGAPVTKFEIVHERPMHLIVVSSDVGTYEHVHPTVDADGTWTAPLPPLEPGRYRLFADLAPARAGAQVLTVDVLVTGHVQPRTAPDPEPVVSVDGIDVALDVGPSPHGFAVTLNTTRDGSVVEPDPYLGARGHLVAIGLGDLSYVHVHPDHDAATGPVRFAMAAPPPGRYRLFFDFSLEGTVHTAAFTVDLTADAPGGRSSE